MSGCEFARLLTAKAQRVVMQTYVDDVTPPASLDATFDEHAKAGRSVIAVFPRIRDEDQLVTFLNALGARWTRKLRSKIAPNGGKLIGLEWATPGGDASEVMGFAPFPSMPVPRRGPYVAFATWPGGRANPFRGAPPTPAGRPNEVSFIDADHGFTEANYLQLWNETTTKVSSLMLIPPDDASLYRRTAFVLSPVIADRLQVA